VRNNATSALAKSIQATEQLLTTPLTQQAGLGTINDAIRNHVKGLSTADRHAFLEEASKRGDDVTLVACCGAPPYLSGMSPEMQQHFTREYHSRKYPAEAKRLKLMQSAHALLVERSPLVFAETDRAIFGTDENSAGNWRKVQQMAARRSEVVRASTAQPLAQ
jgi:hypothetical protein